MYRCFFKWPNLFCCFYALLLEVFCYGGFSGGGKKILLKNWKLWLWRSVCVQRWGKKQFSRVCYDRTMCDGFKLKHRRYSLDMRRNFLTLKSSCFIKGFSRTSLFTPCSLVSLYSFLIPICLVCRLIYYSALLMSRQLGLVGRPCCAETHTDILVSHQCLQKDKPSSNICFLQGLLLCHEAVESHVPTPTSCIFLCNSSLVSPARRSGLQPFSLPLDATGPWVRRDVSVTQPLLQDLARSVCC